jgi:hypothetical protein
VLQPKLDEADYSLVVRTDFSDDAIWKRVCKAIQEPQTESEFQALVECISDKTCMGLTPGAVSALLPEDSNRLFLFIVDSETISKPEHLVLVVDLAEEPGRTFRVVPSEAWSVENNLRLANMGFADFAGSVRADGVFRGDFRGD